MNLWKLDIDGGNPKQLTYGNSDSHAEISPDGKWVVYQFGIFRKSDAMEGFNRRWRAEAVNEAVFVRPCHLPGRKVHRFRLSGWADRQAWNGGHPFEGGEPLKILDVPVRKAPQDQFPWIRWAPDGRSLTYIDDLNGVSNIWSRPVSGGPPKQLTHFTSGQIFNFAWSRDGKQLALARGTETSDVVLITNFR